MYMQCRDARERASITSKPARSRGHRGRQRGPTRTSTTTTGSISSSTSSRAGEGSSNRHQQPAAARYLVAVRARARSLGASSGGSLAAEVLSSACWREASDLVPPCSCSAGGGVSVQCSGTPVGSVELGKRVIELPPAPHCPHRVPYYILNHQLVHYD